MAAGGSSAQFATRVLENVSETIIVAQGDRLVYANPRAERLTGFTVAELTSRPFAALVHPEDLAFVRERYASRMRGDDPDAYSQFRVLRRDGTPVWVESGAVRIELGCQPATLAFMTDLTERRAAEAALRQSEERYRKVIEHMTEGLVVVQDGRVVFVNPATVALSGYTPAELAALDFVNDTIHPEDRAAVLACRRDDEAGTGGTSLYGVRMLRQDGAERRIDLAVVPIDWQGAPALLAFLHDVSERHRLEERLQRTLAERETVLQHSIVAIVMLDGSGRLRWANQATSRMFGADASLARGASLEPYYPSRADYLATGAAVSAAVRRGESYETELLMRRADGRRFWVHLSGKAINPADLARGTVWALLDIDERRRLEEELRRSSSEREAILQSTLVGIAFSRGQQQVWVNRTFADLLGYAPAELLGQPARLYFPSDEAWQDFSARRDAELVPAGSFSGEWPLRRRDGTIFWAEVMGRCLVAGDPASGVIWTMVDITARHQAEADIRAALAQQQELNELKSRFVSMTSHEFRTPLATILSSAELLRHYGGQLPAAERDELLGSIEKAVTRMAAMLEDVLLLGRAEAGRLDFRPAPIELADFCQALVAESTRAELAAGRPGDRVRLELPVAPSRVVLDEKLMRHVLGNLLSNALKYSPPDRPVDFQVKAGAGELRFTISDQGIGIPAEDLPHLFHPFHRARNVGNIQGTGLGLAIVRRALDLHQARIEVASEPGGGSRFAVTVPN